MRALVVFESMYGNTRAVAEAIGDGIRASGDNQVTVVPVSAATRALTADADLLVVGGPTHVRGMSRDPTRHAGLAAAAKPASGLRLDPAADGPGVRDWLEHLDHRSLGAAFDTRLDGPTFVTGRASTRIAHALWRAGVSVITRPESFRVSAATELCPGEAARARDWGGRLAALVPAESRLAASGH